MSNWKRTKDIMPEPLTDVLCMSKFGTIFFGYYSDSDDIWKTVMANNVIGGGKYMVAWHEIPKYDLEDE